MGERNSKKSSEMGIKDQGRREMGMRTEKKVVVRACRAFTAMGKNLDFILNAMGCDLVCDFKRLLWMFSFLSFFFLVA